MKYHSHSCLNAKAGLNILGLVFVGRLSLPDVSGNSLSTFAKLLENRLGSLVGIDPGNSAGGGGVLPNASKLSIELSLSEYGLFVGPHVALRARRSLSLLRWM